MKYLVVCLLLFIIKCYASIEQVGDTQINILNVDNKLIKQNLIEIQCEYGPTHTVHQKEFSTTDGETTINVECPEAIKVYDSNIKGYVPEETYVKSVEICESGVTPLWNYDYRVPESTSRRLEGVFDQSVDEIIAKRQEVLTTFDKMVNTDILGCVSNSQFYGGNSTFENACNNNGTRYSLWKPYMKSLFIAYDGEDTNCWNIFNNIVLTGGELNYNDLPSNNAERRVAVGNLFRCFIAINGFANMKSASGQTETNLWCSNFDQAPGFNQDRELMGLNDDGGPTCSVAAWTGAGAAAGAGTAVGAVAVAKTTVALTAAAVGGIATAIAGFFTAPLLIAYCANGDTFKGAAIRVTKDSFLAPRASYILDTRCSSHAMAFDEDCFPSVSLFLFYYLH